MAGLASLAQLVESGDGYPLLALAVLLSAAGLPLPISALLVAVGVASAHVSGPLLILLCALCTLAAVAGDSLDYLLGRAGAPAFVRRCVPWLARLCDRLGLRQSAAFAVWRERMLARSSGSPRRAAILALFTSRFVPPLMPLATPISVALGASRFAVLPFLIWDLLGEAVFVGGNVALGRLLSGPLVQPGIGALLLWSSLAVLGLAPALLALLWPRRPHRPRCVRPAASHAGDGAQAHADGQTPALASA